MILKATDCDILLTYSHHKDPCKSHSVSGHFFEVMDYYFILRNHFRVKVLLGELTRSIAEYIVENRYIETPDYDDFIFNARPKLIQTNCIFVTDGSYLFFNENNIIAKHKISFGCGNSYMFIDRPKDVIFLEDHRIYKHSKEWCDNHSNTIDYVKKILPFKIPEYKDNRIFVHMTGNCRKYNHHEIIEKYPDCLIFSDYIEPSYNVTNKPVRLGEFNRYLYTPIMRKFDCSPRLIAECDHMNIPVEYYNIDYFDPGLKARKLDIKNKCYLLKENDVIIDIIRDIIK